MTEVMSSLIPGNRLRTRKWTILFRKLFRQLKSTITALEKLALNKTSLLINLIPVSLES